ncbi:hypothetical protein [Streptosporangium sp. NPDC003464]
MPFAEGFRDLVDAMAGQQKLLMLRWEVGIKAGMCEGYGEGLSGMVAVAVIKSTNVVVEISGHERVAGHL